jgi:chemosensory pili system protein ChpA (sensor histidine kinase/response regulator)
VRRRGATRDLPIAVLTTRAGDKHARLARDLGATHYLTKPVDEPTLVGLLTALLTPAAEAAGVR